MKILAATAALVLMASCGSDGGVGGGGTYSCDFTKNGDHGCVEYHWATGSPSTVAWAAACTADSGTAGSGCTHSGAVGGCLLTQASGGTSISYTTWYYKGTASTLMQACAALSGTFQTP